MKKPIDDSGAELDALFSVEMLTEKFDLIVESRGGSDHGPNPARNSDYAPAMELHLSRMKNRGMTIHEVQVASSLAMRLKEVERRVNIDNFSLPLDLSSVTDIRKLRNAIGRASAAFGRSIDDGRGNRTKRMRLRISWPAAAGMTANDIEAVLAQRTIESSNEEPTADPIELQKRVARSTAHIRAAAGNGYVPPPAGQMNPRKAAGASSRFVRDPNVIAWVLNEAAGRCEVCSTAAPFLRDDGQPYLEVHHVRPLADGGPDTIDNTVACCPNCHRRLHYDRVREAIRRNMIKATRRLRDYPVVAVTPAL